MRTELGSDPTLGLLERKMRELLSATGGIGAAHSAAPWAATAAEPSAAVAAAYHLDAGGQRVRARLALAAGAALGLQAHDALCIAAATELLHNASLLHDDVQDGDVLRRGQPTVEAKFGSHVAICTGDLLLSAAYAALCGISVPSQLPALLALVHECVASTISGQCADLAAVRSPVASLAAYQQVAMAKSGALLSLPLELALWMAGHGAWAAQARTAAQAFAVGYQVVDDLADVQSDMASGALNIVAVLQRATPAASARADASQFGLTQLDAAIVLAEQLPSGSGTLLVQLARKLKLLILVKNDSCTL